MTEEYLDVGVDSTRRERFLIVVAILGILAMAKVSDCREKEAGRRVRELEVQVAAARTESDECRRLLKKELREAIEQVCSVCVEKENEHLHSSPVLVEDLCPVVDQNVVLGYQTSFQELEVTWEGYK